MASLISIHPDVMEGALAGHSVGNYGCKCGALADVARGLVAAIRNPVFSRRNGSGEIALLDTADDAERLLQIFDPREVC